jgi:glycosyltransferase involved in cell wall biosynthesis
MRIKRVWATRFDKLSLIGRTINQLTYAASVMIHMLLRRDRRPVLVVTNPPYLAAICALRRLLGGSPYMYLIHDVYPDTAVNLGLLKKDGLAARLWDALNSFTFHQASKIIVIGRCMRDIIAKKAGTSAGKIEFIHIWSDDLHITPLPKNENPFVQQWGLEGKFVLSYSGNMGRFHDMETIMASARELKENENIVFLFIGEGHKKQWAIEYAKLHGLDNCRFHDYVPRESLGLSLAAADVGLVSLLPGQEGLSVPSKTFGLMSAGLPVLAVMPEASEIARVIGEERCGILIVPGDHSGLTRAILSLYDDRELLQAMGRRGRSAVERAYNLRLASDRFRDLLSGLMP